MRAICLIRIMRPPLSTFRTSDWGFIVVSELANGTIDFEPYHDRMQITVNGILHEAPEESTVSSLLDLLDLNDRPCAVEVNRQIIRKADHQLHRLAAEDTVEVVSLVGGG